MKSHSLINFFIFSSVGFYPLFTLGDGSDHEAETTWQYPPTEITVSEVDVPREISSVADARKKYAELLKLRERLAKSPLPKTMAAPKGLPSDSQEAKAQAMMKQMASIYSQLFDVHRKQPGKDNNEFHFVDSTNALIRKISSVRGSLGSSPAELLWEHELSSAMAAGGSHQNTEDILNKLIKHRAAWSQTNPMGSPLPTTEGAERIADSFSLARVSLVALGTASWAAFKVKHGDSLTVSEQEILAAALKNLFSHRYFREPAKSPNSRSQIDISQIPTWGKIYSLDLIKILESEPKLIQHAPSEIQDAAQRKDLVKSIQDNLFANITAFKANPRMEDGIGGSFFHTSLTFAALGVLRKEQVDSIYPNLKMIKASKDDGVWPYTPVRNPNSGETPRSSAGRSSPIAITRMINNPSSDSAEKGVSALEQFYNFSGSYRAHVARTGAHSGDDHLAPYYWAPGLQSAGKLAKLLSEQAHLLSPEYQSRLLSVVTNLNNTTKASFDPKTNIVTHPGISFFQQIGPTFSTGLTMAALNDLDTALENLGKSPKKAASNAFDPDPATLDQVARTLKSGIPGAEQELETFLRQFDSVSNAQKNLDRKHIAKLLNSWEVGRTSAAFTILVTRALQQSTQELDNQEILFLTEAQETVGDDLVSQKIREMAGLALLKRQIGSK